MILLYAGICPNCGNSALNLEEFPEEKKRVLSCPVCGHIIKTETGITHNPDSVEAKLLSDGFEVVSSSLFNQRRRRKPTGILR